MFSLSESFRIQKDYLTKKGTRSRILGEFSEDELIFMVNTVDRTYVELVNRAGDSTTVFSSVGYRDLINADLSKDKSLLHLTERAVTADGFIYKSEIIDIFSSARSQEFISDSVISAVFLPRITAPSYEMLHIIGSKLSHVRLTSMKKAIVIDKVRGGVNMLDTISWTYSKVNNLLFVIYSTPEGFFAADFRFKSKTIVASTPSKINLLSPINMPPELALHPSTPNHLPVFRTFMNRIYKVHYLGNTCVVQQVYDEDLLTLKFSVVTYPVGNNQTVTAHAIRADYPLCFLQFGHLGFVFVPNICVWVIDITGMNPILILPEIFALIPVDLCCATIIDTSLLVDLETGGIYDVKIALTQPDIYAYSMEESSWALFKILVAKYLSPEDVAKVLEVLRLSGNVYMVQEFINEVMNIVSYVHPVHKAQSKKSMQRHRSLAPLSIPRMNLSLPDDLDETLAMYNNDYPTDGPISRSQMFWRLMKVHSETSSPEQIIMMMSLQNKLCDVLSQAVTIWAETFDPPSIWKAALVLNLITEAKLHNFPRFAIFKHEMEAFMPDFVSRTQVRTLHFSCIFPSKNIDDFESEQDYWTRRLPESVFEPSDSSYPSRICRAYGYNSTQSQFDSIWSN